MTVPPQRLLLVTPTFHGYYRSIDRAFRARGYDVEAHCYDAYGSVLDKVRNKVMFELPTRLGIDGTKAAEEWGTRRALAALRRFRPHRLVVIKGDTLGHAFWEEVSRLRIPVILWLYDDLTRHSYDDDFLRNVGPVISYARSEAEMLTGRGVHATYLPNAFDPHLVGTSPLRTEEIVFVGARYPNRVEILTGLHSSGVPVRCYGRQWSHHAFDRVRTWEISRPPVPSHRDISLEQAYTVQAEAAAAVNIHGLQAGLAMRAFEVPGMAGLQLVDRPDIEEHYDVGTEVLVFGNQEELRDLAMRAIRDHAWAERIRQAARRRSLAKHTFDHRIARVDGLWA